MRPSPLSSCRMCMVGLAAVFLAIPCCLFAAAPERQEQPVVHLLIFLSKDCSHCSPIERPALEAMSAQLRCTVKPTYFDIADMKNYKLLVCLERESEDTGNEMPVVFVGEHVLGGVKEIEDKLEKLIEQAARAGGSPPIKLPSSAEVDAAFAQRPVDRTIHLAYFEEPGCRACRRVEHMISFHEKQSAMVKVKRFISSKRENKLLLEVLCERAAVSEDRRLIVPSVFIGNDALIDEEVSDERLTHLLAKYAGEGAPVIWRVEESDIAVAQERLQQRFEKIGRLAVVLGGLVDGVNPCAFATIVFFIAYLAAKGRSKRQMLEAGIAFCTGVFTAYFALGFGLSEVLFRFEAMPVVAMVIRWAVVALVFVLAALSLYDAVVAWRGAPKQMVLRLSANLRMRINLLITRRTRSRYLIPASLLLGATISLLELVCTGQVYLPLIQFMLSVSVDRIRTLALLLLYNLAFVAPLLAVFVAAFLGIRSEALSAVARRHVVTSKLLLAGFFMGLGAVMLVLR